MLDLTTLLIAAAVVLAFGLVSGAMATGRNRDGALWFIIGAIFGPLAILALLFFGGSHQRS